MRVSYKQPSERSQAERAERRLPDRERCRGAVLMVTLVCIGVASLMFLVLLRLSVAERRGAKPTRRRSRLPCSVRKRVRSLFMRWLRQPVLPR